MLTEPLIQQLQQLHLKGMAQALEQQMHAEDGTGRSFEDRLGLMIQNELTERASHRLAQRLRWAKLPQNACLEDLDARTPRGVDPGQLAQLTELTWIKQHLNLLITGPTGVGKSYLAAALAHAACRADFSVRCFRLPRLVEEFARYAALQKRSPCSNNWPASSCWSSMTSDSHRWPTRRCAICSKCWMIATTAPPR